jgi:hypothetical protein
LPASPTDRRRRYQIKDAVAQMEQRKTNPKGTTPDQRLSWSEGLEAKEIFLAFRSRENYFP